MFFEISNFYPDFPSNTPNIMVDCTNLVPYMSGYTSMSSLAPLDNMQQLSQTCVGLFFVRRVDDTTYLVAGEPDRISRKQGNSWTIVSSISLGPIDRWRFAQQGNIVFAVNKSTPSLAANTLTFAAVVGMPQCNIVDTVLDFVMIGDTSEATYGDQGDRWWCSALGDYTDWTPDTGTQSATNRLVDTAGAFTAGKKLGDQFVFYKKRGIWLGEFVGPPPIWKWTLKSREVGALSNECVVNIDYQHYFIGEEDFYVFDGTVPVPIGDGIKEYFFTRLVKQYSKNIIGIYDWYKSIIYWFYPSTDSGGQLNSVISYNIKTKKWGAGTVSIQAASNWVADGLTYDDLWAGLTWDTIPDTIYDEIGAQNTALTPVFVNSSAYLCTLTGEAMGSTLRTSYIGDDASFSKVTRIRPRFTSLPTNAEVVPSNTQYLGNNRATGSSYVISNGAFKFTQAARWHQFDFSFSGSTVLLGLDIEMFNAGRK